MVGLETTKKMQKQLFYSPLDINPNQGWLRNVQGLCRSVYHPLRSQIKLTTIHKLFLPMHEILGP